METPARSHRVRRRFFLDIDEQSADMLYDAIVIAVDAGMPGLEEWERKLSLMLNTTLAQSVCVTAPGPHSWQ